MAATVRAARFVRRQRGRRRRTAVSTHSGTLALRVAGLDFQNPVVLAAGTAAYGRDLAGVVDLEALGGLVTKAVSPEPRAGAPSPRVAEFDGGMINAVGLANPGVSAVRRGHLPLLRSAVSGGPKIGNTAGFVTQRITDGVAELASAQAAPRLRSPR